MKYFAISLNVIALSGCIAGGIAQFHDTSANYFSRDQYHISLELGAPGGNAKRAFKSAQVVIADLPPIDMVIIKATKETVLFTATFARSTLPTKPSDYYFTYSELHSGIHVFRPDKAVTSSN